MIETKSPMTAWEELRKLIEPLADDQMAEVRQ
jgi:hypothetical protein